MVVAVAVVCAQIQNNPHAGSKLRIAPYAHVNDGLMGQSHSLTHCSPPLISFQLLTSVPLSPVV